MAKESARLVSGGAKLAAQQLKLCRAKLAVVATRTTKLNRRLKLLDIERRLFRTRYRFWRKEAKLLNLKETCNELVEVRRPRRKKRKTDGGASLEERLSLVKAELASALKDQHAAERSRKACAKRRVALEAEISHAKTATRDKAMEVRAFVRNRRVLHMVVAQLLPHEMLREIFSHLSPEDRVTAGQVCSKWRAVTRYDCSLWKDTKVSIPDCLGPGQHDPSCRVMAAAPYLDEVRVFKEYYFRLDLKIRKLIILSCGSVREQFILKSCQERLAELTALSLVIRNHVTARILDSSCTALKELSIGYCSKSPFNFKRSFVKQSTLTCLRCCGVPLLTLYSIIHKHSGTLESISLIRSFRGMDHYYGSLHLTIGLCAQLKFFQVDCRVTFTLPPSCVEVQLVLMKTYKKCRTRCAGCLSLTASQSTSVTRLRLICDDVTVDSIKRHLRALGKVWLASLEEVSIHFKTLTNKERAAIADVAGRSVVFRGPGRADLIKWSSF